jgi:hypothetical protein
MAVVNDDFEEKHPSIDRLPPDSGRNTLPGHLLGALVALVQRVHLL